MKTNLLLQLTRFSLDEKNQRIVDMLHKEKDWMGKSNEELKQMICANKSWIQLNLKKKRNRKKFQKNWLKYISKHIQNKYFSYLLRILAFPLVRKLNYADIANKFVSVQKMDIPTGLLYTIDKTE